MERPQAATRDVRPDVRPRVDVGVEAQAGEPTDQRLDHDLCLEPGERRAQAEVRPEPEAEVARRRPLDPEDVGIVEAGGIAVGRSERLADEVAGSQRHAADLGVLGHVAQVHLERGVVAQHLLDRRRDEVGPLAQQGRAGRDAGRARSCRAR